jgi:hypothetical protein
MNTELPTYLASAAWLRESGYAPAPIAPGHRMPAGPWAAIQLMYNERAHPDELAAVFTAVPMPRGPGPDVILDAKATHLITLRVNARDDLVPQLQAIVAKYVGAAKCPVRVSADGEHVYLFAAAASAVFTEKRAHLEYSTVSLNYFPECIALAADHDGQPYEWPKGDLFSARRSELAALDNDACDALMADIQELFAKFAPPAPPPAQRVAKPIIAPGERMTWENKRARSQLVANGWDIVPIPFGRQAPDPRLRMGPTGEYLFDRKKPPSEFGVGVVTSLDRSTFVALELSSRSAEVAADLEKLGFADKTAPILAGIGAIVKRFAGDAKVPVRRDSKGGQVFLFRSAGAFTAAGLKRLLSVQGKTGTAVAVAIYARNVCMIYSGDDAAGKPYTWENDLLSTKHHEVPVYSASILKDIEAFMESGAGLLDETRAAGTAAKRTRKAG